MAMAWEAVPEIFVKTYINFNKMAEQVETSAQDLGLCFG
jgi:hypothetical protein